MRNRIVIKVKINDMSCFFEIAEKNIPIEIKEELTNIKPEYPVIICAKSI